MSETPQPDPNVRAGEEHFVQDPVEAELMAYAEKPHREYAATLREAVDGEITNELEEHYQKHPDHHKTTWEQKGDEAYKERDELLDDKKHYLEAAKNAIILGNFRALGVSRRYRQDKKAEEAARPIDVTPAIALEPEPAQLDTQESVEQVKDSEPIYGVARLSTVNGENVSVHAVDEEALMRKIKELVESGQVTESLPIDEKSTK